MDTQVGQHDMHKAFPTGRGKETIVTSLGDITLLMLT